MSHTEVILKDGVWPLGVWPEFVAVEHEADTLRSLRTGEEPRYMVYVPESTCRWVYFDDTVSTSDAYEFGWHYECSECGFDPEGLLGADVDHDEVLGVLVYCPNCGAKVVEHE